MDPHRPPGSQEPVDPVEIRARAGSAALVRRQRLPVLMVALGGAVGACARYGASLLWPTPAGAFPWTTLAVNAVGCAAIGVLLVIVTDVRVAHRLVRPFFGTGFLGGFTTFSTYAVDVRQLAAAGQVRVALGYLLTTLAAALVAVWLSATTTRRLVRRRTR